MSCNDFLSLLHPYFDGEASPVQREAVDDHLVACETCRIALEELRLTWQALDALPEPPVPAVSAEVVLRDARSQERKILWLRSAGAVAAVALIAVSLWSFGFFEGPSGGDRGWIDWESVADADHVLIENLDLLEAIELEDLDFLENLELIEYPSPELLEHSENG